MLETNGTDTALGFNLGVLVTPLRNEQKKPILNFALVYRSPVTLDASGKFLVNDRPVADAAFQIKLPWVLTGGVAGWPIRDERREWKLEVNFDYADWTRFDNLDVHLSTGVTLPFPRQWEAGYVVMVGTEYRWLQLAALPGWEMSARAGYFHSWTPVPDRTFDPAVPDADYNAFAIGLGLLCRGPGRFLAVIPCPGRVGQRGAIALDLAYQIVLFDARQISNNHRSPGERALGDHHPCRCAQFPGELLTPGSAQRSTRRGAGPSRAAAAPPSPPLVRACAAQTAGLSSRSVGPVSRW